MKISLNEIKKYVNVPEEVTTEELVRLIGARLVEVEGTEDLAEKYKGITIVRVAECEKIPETHLSLCRVDDGSGELTQVVCGAPNVHKGMLTAWIRPGAIVPATFGEENFRLSVRKLRGYESNGMLAAMDELALGDNHEGIVEIEPGFAQAGDSFAEAFGLNDVILDIENKSLTHRPDCFGIIGFAREVHGIISCVSSVSSPGFSRSSSRGSDPIARQQAPQCDSTNETLEITISGAGICDKYCCAVVKMEGATEKSKYLTLDDVFLAKAGMRGISKIVDVTNILMLLTGQPLHAFDYDKFLKAGGSKTAKVGVRLAKEGEKLQLLDGKTISCDTNDILITSNDVPVALAGAMGGASTEIDASTKRVLLESATFSLYHLRKTQMKHGIFSEAITRFTKGQPAGNALPVLLSAIELLSGKGVLPLVASASPVAMMPEGEVSNNEPIQLSVKQINSLLGTEYSGAKCCKTLENVGFVVDSKKKGEDTLLEVTAPYWRTDIHIPEDIIEEIGRLNGFDNIPKTLASRSFIGAKLDPMLTLKSRIREILADELGAHEVLTYSFVSKSLQEKVLEDPKQSYEIVNSLSPELEVFRQSLTPSLLEKTYDNLKAGYKDFALFEMNQVTNRKLGLDGDGVPKMENRLAMVLVGNYYEVKVRVERLIDRLGKEMRAQGMTKGAKYFEPKRSGEICIMGGEKVKTIGVMGEIKNSVRRKMKLEPVVTAVEISLDELLVAEDKPKKSIRVSKFPTVGRDVTVRVAKDVAYDEVREMVIGGLVEPYAGKMAKKAKNAKEFFETPLDLVYSVEPKSIYERGDGYKNISFHLEFADVKKTLGEKEIKALMASIDKTVKDIKGEII